MITTLEPKKCMFCENNADVQITITVTGISAIGEKKLEKLNQPRDEFMCMNCLRNIGMLSDEINDRVQTMAEKAGT